MKNCWPGCLIAVVLLAPTRVDADVWGVNTNSDNTSSTTRNQLVALEPATGFSFDTAGVYKGF
jgi:hypothetical protein